MKRRPAITRRHWTVQEDWYLQRAWGEVSPEVLMRRFPDRTWQAIWQHAVGTLGLPRGVPQGYETLRSAAQRTGYAVRQLRKILAFAGVRVRHWYGGGRTSMHVGGRDLPRNPWCAVDPIEANEAVARWCRLETVATAARRHGCSSDTLRRMLRAAGLLPPADPIHRIPARLDPAQVDAVLAAHARGA